MNPTPASMDMPKTSIQRNRRVQAGAGGQRPVVPNTPKVLLISPPATTPSAIAGRSAVTKPSQPPRVTPAAKNEHRHRHPGRMGAHPGTQGVLSQPGLGIRPDPSRFADSASVTAVAFAARTGNREAQQHTRHGGVHPDSCTRPR